MFGTFIFCGKNNCLFQFSNWVGCTQKKTALALSWCYVIILCVKIPALPRRQSHSPREEAIDDKDLRDNVHCLTKA